MLNPTDKELIVRQGQKVAHALPPYTELMVPRQELDEGEFKGSSGQTSDASARTSTSVQIKSVASVESSERSTPSGRSNFPTKDEMELKAEKANEEVRHLI